VYGALHKEDVEMNQVKPRRWIATILREAEKTRVEMPWNTRRKAAISQARRAVQQKVSATA